MKLAISPTEGDTAGVLAGAVNSAITHWKDLGIPLTFESATSLCVPTDRHCVQVVAKTPTNDDIVGCGGVSEPTLDPDGTIAEALEIDVDPHYTSWDDGVLAATLAHEFGHAMGLGNQVPHCDDATGAPASIMNTHSTAACNHLDEMPLQPLPGDAIPILQSVYNGIPAAKKVCR